MDFNDVLFWTVMVLCLIAIVGNWVLGIRSLPGMVRGIGRGVRFWWREARKTQFRQGPVNTVTAAGSTPNKKEGKNDVQ